jgi:hypothetical protein
MIISEVTPQIHKNISSAAKQYFKNSSFETAQFRFSEAIKKFGWHEGKSGSRSTIYTNPRKSFIMKVNDQQDEGFAAYVSLIRKNPNPHFPKISNLKRFKVNGRVFYIYLMEKLAEIPHAKAVKYVDWMEDYLSANLNNESVAKLTQKLPKELGISIIDALNIVRNYADRYRIFLDFSEDNIMQRKDGTIVITDPYV